MSDLDLSEDAWKSRVMDTASLHGWRCVHIRPARTAHGWRTPYEGDGGLPDLVIAKGGTVRLAELKSQKGGFRPGQREWLAAAGEHGHLWRPGDWEDVLAVLAGGA